MSIYVTFALSLFAKTLFENYLEKLNKNAYENTQNQKKAMDFLKISKEHFSKTIHYTVDKYRFSLISTWISVLTIIAFIGLGGFGAIESLTFLLSAEDSNSLTNGVLFFLFLMIISSVFQTPFNLSLIHI